MDLWDCAVEVFTATRAIKLRPFRLAEVVLRDDLLLLDLRGDGAMSIGGSAALAKSGPRVTTQAWARHVYEHADHYARDGQPVDGLAFWNAHNDGFAVALFERAADRIVCHRDDPLDHPTLRLALEARARPFRRFVVE